MTGRMDSDGAVGRRIAARAGRDGGAFGPSGAFDSPPAQLPDDPIDRLGTRIGRALGLLLTLGLLAGLVLYVLGRSAA